MSAAERHPPLAGPIRPGLKAKARAAGKRLLLATLAGLVLAGIVHIVAILLIPLLAERDAATVYRELGMHGRAELIARSRDGRAPPGPRESDPFLATAVCSYDLSAGPMRVLARTGTLPLGLTLHRQGGGVIYAITDRAAIRGAVAFVVMTEEQRDELAASEEEGEAAHELRVVSDTPTGLVVVRVLVKRPSDREDAEALATGVVCGMAE